MADEVDEVVTVPIETIPDDPTRFVVLAIRIVVAVLRVADFIAGQNERHALCEQQTCKLVFAKLAAKRRDRRVVGRTFMAAIVAVVVVGAVAIVFAIGFVVLLVVAEQVGQG